jgi:general secretion pathway protein E
VTTLPRLDPATIPQKLVAAGLLSRQGLDRLQRLWQSPEPDLLSILVSRGLVGEEDLYVFLAGAAGLQYKHLDPLELDYEIVTSSIPGAFAQRNSVVVFGSSDDSLLVATSNVLDPRPLEDLTHMLGKEIKLFVSKPSDVARVVRQFYGLHSSIVAAAKEVGGLGGEEQVDLGNLERYVSSETAKSLEPTDRPIVNAVNHLLQYAFEERASDIHLEPHRDGTVVRFRIDGVLHNIYSIPKKLHLPVLSRVKMIAGMNIAEKRRPQDGRIRTHFEGKPVEIRMSTIPVAFGEKAVLRILDPSILMQDLSCLGFEPEDQKRFEALTKNASGLILVTGPTGSGKTTTLYSTLTTLATNEKNITTIEDPIEFVADEFNQIAVQNAVDVTFTNALRHVLRQDPDIIMVGEIRDVETARSALRCSLTGHLVLSTLHTNDTSSTAVRLLDMGMEPFLLCSTLIGIVAQRLMRKVCPDCGEDYTPSDSVLQSLGLSGRSLIFRRGKGCRSCRGTGYKGRTAIFEVMDVGERIRTALARSSSTDEIRRIATEEGMSTLRTNALRKVLAGITTPSEMLNATMGAE